MAKLLWLTFAQLLAQKAIRIYVQSGSLISSQAQTHTPNIVLFTHLNCFSAKERETANHETVASFILLAGNIS